MNYPFGGFPTRLDKDINAGAIKNFSVNPYITMQKVVNGKYLLTFQNMCYTSEPHPGILKVDQNILKEKLNNWVKPSDKKYIKLISYDTNKSTFEFNIDKWLDDGLKNCRPYMEIGGLTKSYRLGVQLPYMFRTNGLEMLYTKFICDNFKKTIKNNSRLRKDVFSIVEDLSNKILGVNSVNMFDYSYNVTSNAVTVSLKPIYIGGLLAAASILVKKKKLSKKKDFDETVKKYGKFIKK